MSRLVASLTLLASLTSLASAGDFARPPAAVAPADLRAPSPPVTRAEVRAALAEARAANLEHFRGYYSARSYPSNVYAARELNVWRDLDGKYCAAATIIRRSGNVELVEKIAEQDNFIKLGEVRRGEVISWILTSGFTQAEIAMIQKPFRPVVTETMGLRPSDTIVDLDESLRAKETARLAALYRAIDQKLVRAEKASLDAAVDRLMKQPGLAAQLVHGS